VLGFLFFFIIFLSDSIHNMQWFPVGRDDSSGWRLDVVSLITILGESLMARHIQPLTASKLCLLPRIIPAPQAFLGSTRAARLPSLPNSVCGVYSGTLVQELNYFANVLLPITTMKNFEVAIWHITLSSKILIRTMMIMKPEEVLTRWQIEAGLNVLNARL